MVEPPAHKTDQIDGVISPVDAGWECGCKWCAVVYTNMLRQVYGVLLRLNVPWCGCWL
jgi:hypothetical protein